MMMRPGRFFLWSALLVAALCGGRVPADDSGLVRYALSDLRVLYLFSDTRAVDWPVLYHLNDRFGARIDLVSVERGVAYRYRQYVLPDRRIYWHRFEAEGGRDITDSVAMTLLGERRPDIVIIADTTGDRAFARLAQRFLTIPPDTAALFDIARVFLESGRDTARTETPGTVITLNRHELYRRYGARIAAEVPELGQGLLTPSERKERLAVYRMSVGRLDRGELGPDFFAGFPLLRLQQNLSRRLPSGGLQVSLQRRAERYVNLMSAARRADGPRRAELAIQAYREIRALRSETSQGSAPPPADLVAYLDRLTERARAAVMREIGLDWRGRIIIRDSPHGPRLKFRAEVAADGPNPVELSYIRFHPYWQDTVIVVDSVSRMIAPHQAFVREYLLDIDRTWLEAERPESLLFTAEVVYGDLPLELTAALPVWQRPELSVAFEPDFYFIPPVARVDIDHTAVSMHWTVLIRKPSDYHGAVRVELETPRGMFAGAYRKQLDLKTGYTMETLHIPFSVSNLFELGIQRCTVQLRAGGRIVAADTARIRIAECRLKDDVTIGFLPDSAGTLEDVLRMTGAPHRPLTQRALLTADLSAYSVIVIGSGALRQYPDFRNYSSLLSAYLQAGGSVLLLGQPDDWPEGVLPVAFVPTPEEVTPDQVEVRLPQARTLNRTYTVSVSGLLRYLEKRPLVPAALVSPSEKVLLTPSGATLLSVSRIGEGQIIFCGLPLTDMVAALNIDAIHLLANLLNY